MFDIGIVGKVVFTYREGFEPGIADLAWVARAEFFRLERRHWVYAAVWDAIHGPSNVPLDSTVRRQMGQDLGHMITLPSVEYMLSQRPKFEFYKLNGNKAVKPKKESICLAVILTIDFVDMRTVAN